MNKLNSIKKTVHQNLLATVDSGFRNRILNSVFNKEELPEGNLFLALTTQQIELGLQEPSPDTGYMRVEILPEQMSDSVDGLTTNTELLTFTPFSAALGNIWNIAVVYEDGAVFAHTRMSLTGYNPVYVDELDTIIIEAGGLRISLLEGV